MELSQGGWHPCYLPTVRRFGACTFFGRFVCEINREKYLFGCLKEDKWFYYRNYMNFVVVWVKICIKIVFARRFLFFVQFVLFFFLRADVIFVVLHGLRRKVRRYHLWNVKCVEAKEKSNWNPKKRKQIIFVVEVPGTGNFRSCRGVHCRKGAMLWSCENSSLLIRRINFAILVRKNFEVAAVFVSADRGERSQAYQAVWETGAASKRAPTRSCCRRHWTYTHHSAEMLPSCSSGSF